MSVSPLVLSVTSGKGGVGKTNLSVNLAYSLARKGARVVLLDADLGLANVDVLLGLTPQNTLLNLFDGSASIEEVLYPTPYNFSILPASSGVNDMLNLNAGQKMTLLESMDSLENKIDYLIVDTGAGIHDNVLYFNVAAQERLIVLTTEPTSLTDAYALIKVLKTQYNISNFKVVVNMAKDQFQARDVFSRLSSACDHFLENVSLDYLSFIPQDANVRKSVIQQKPFCALHQKSPASLAVYKIAQHIEAITPPQEIDGNIKFFWKSLLFRNT